MKKETRLELEKVLIKLGEKKIIHDSILWL
jgi:hypothetical protein